MLESIEAYSRYIYGLLDNNAAILNHTVAIYPRGATLGVLEGEVRFAASLTLHIYERLDFAQHRIVAYSYEIWRANEQLRWYDPQPHPDDPTLAETHPHHLHEPPDIKHHRLPAHGITFDSPNLALLIDACLVMA